MKLARWRKSFRADNSHQPALAHNFIYMAWVDRELPILEAVREPEDSGQQPFYIDSRLKDCA